MITRSPISAAMIVEVAPIAPSRPMRTSGPITALAPMIEPAPISAPRPITAPGSTTTPASSRAVGCTRAAGEMPVSSKTEPGLTALGKSFAITAAIEQYGAARGRSRCIGWRDKHGGGARRPQGVEVLGIVEEGQVAGSRLVERGHVADNAASNGLRGQRGAAPACNFADRRRCNGREKTDLRQ